jgi:hypothetical protein
MVVLGGGGGSYGRGTLVSSAQTQFWLGCIYMAAVFVGIKVSVSCRSAVASPPWSLRGVQGYLAHKKTPTSLEPP